MHLIPAIVIYGVVGRNAAWRFDINSTSSSARSIASPLTKEGCGSLVYLSRITIRLDFFCAVFACWYLTSLVRVEL
jgi:hypothetical protein